MDANVLIAFTMASALLVLIPGPVVLLIVANSLNNGTKHGIATALSAGTAHMTMLAVAAFGLTTIMGLMAEWFDIIRWLGVAYLVYLGLQQFRAPTVALEDMDAQNIPVKRMLIQAFIVAWTNPKTLIFYAAFFPQFIDPTQAFGPQMLVLSTIFMVVSLLLDSGYALLAGKVRGLLTGHRGAVIRNRATGSILMAAAAGLALVRKGSP